MQLPHRILHVADQAHRAQHRLVLVTGVFDLLHQEHRNFLQRAKAAGDVLLVGLESDTRVRQLKGEGRPIDTQAVRQQKIEALDLADGVFILPEVFDQPEHHLELLKRLKPDILAVSSHTPHLDNKQQLMSIIGGRVEVVLVHNPEVSTTHLIESTHPEGSAL